MAQAGEGAPPRLAGALAAHDCRSLSQWPLPAWLAPESPLPAGSPVLLVVTPRSGTPVVCHATRAQVLGARLGIQATDLPEPLDMPLQGVRMVTLVPRLLRQTDPAHPREAVHFVLSMTDGEVVEGMTLGALPMVTGVFLYVESSPGACIGTWFPALNLQRVKVGRREWQVAAPTGSLRYAQAFKPVPPPPPARTVLELREAALALRRRPVPSIEAVLHEIGHWPDSRRPAGVPPDMKDLRAVVPPDVMRRALARMAAVPEADLAQFAMDARVADRLPERLAREHGAVPLGMEEGILYVACREPTDHELRARLSLAVNGPVELVWAPPGQIADQLARREQRVNSSAILPAAGQAEAHATPVADSLDVLVLQAMDEVRKSPQTELVMVEDEGSSIVRIVKKMIEDAKTQGASDIHVETNPGEEFTRVRFRKDGDLEPYLNLPGSLRAPLVSRIKVMSRLDIAERRRPQDGKINFAEFGGSALELRVAILPTHDGLEDVVMRLLAASKPVPLEKLGFQRRDFELIHTLSKRSYGMILAAGPTGSGKTTTLHSILSHINTEERKIWTAEDPIEITQPGLRQLQVNPKIGLTFASAMRAFLRADPDVIMIGEVRDAETAGTAIDASLTGHLVLSTLHTNNASESVTRLLELGMDPLNFSDSLLLVIAQRLVRALCGKCARQVPLDDAGLDQLVHDYCVGTSISADEARARLLAAGGLDSAASAHMHEAVGCEHCGGKGYKGRVGVYELLENTPQIKLMIKRRASPTEVFDSAVAAGMRSLRHDALEKVMAGRIDMAQARVVLN